jgi:vacuolar-type H+-ATPase subunit E/Vma4
MKNSEELEEKRKIKQSLKANANKIKNSAKKIEQALKRNSEKKVNKRLQPTLWSLPRPVSAEADRIWSGESPGMAG